MGSLNEENIGASKIPLCTYIICSIAIFIVTFLVFKDKLVFENQILITEKHFDPRHTNLTHFSKSVGSNNTSNHLPAIPLFIQSESTPETLQVTLPEHSNKQRITEFYIYEGPGFDFYKDCLEWYAEA